MEPRFQKAFTDMVELEKGAIADPDKGRMVGHYWLRNSELAPNSFLKSQIKQTLHAICSFAIEVVSGKIKPHIHLKVVLHKYFQLGSEVQLLYHNLLQRLWHLITLLLRWSILFDQMVKALSEEEKQLDNWLNKVNEMQLHYDQGLKGLHWSTFFLFPKPQNIEKLQLERAEKLEDNRKAIKDVIAGPKSYVQVRNKLQQQNVDKQPPTHVELYVTTRKRTVGRTYKAAEEHAKAKIARLEEIQLSGGENRAMSVDSALGNTCLLGRGLKPRKLIGPAVKYPPEFVTELRTRHKRGSETRIGG